MSTIVDQERRALSSDELSRMFESCRSFSVQNRALLALRFAASLTCEELGALNVEHLSELPNHPESMRIEIPVGARRNARWKNPRGKTCPFCGHQDRILDGRPGVGIYRRRRECVKCEWRFTTDDEVEKPRIQEVSGEVLRAVRAWLDARPAPSRGALFRSLKGRRPLARELHNTLGKIAARAGVEPFSDGASANCCDVERACSPPGRSPRGGFRESPREVVGGASKASAILPVADAAAKLGVPPDHPAALYVASVSIGSRRAMLFSIREAAKFLGGTPASVSWATLTFGHLTALRSALAERYSPSAGNRILCAVRRVLKFASRMGLIRRDDVAKAIDLPPILGARVTAGRALSRDELRALFGACEARGAIGLRDRCLLALLCGAGLRRSELVALDVSDVSADLGEIRVRHGKGDKERHVPLPSNVADACRDWLRFREGLPDLQSRALLLSTAFERLAVKSVWYVLSRLCTRAGVAHCSPHDLRRTYVSELLDAGVDLVTVQKLAGHAVLASTVGYDRRPYRSRREAVQRLHVGEVRVQHERQCASAATPTFRSDRRSSARRRALALARLAKGVGDKL